MFVSSESAMFSIKEDVLDLNVVPASMIQFVFVAYYIDAI